MRTPEQTIEHPFTIPETDEAELTIGLPFQATPFTIAGDTEALIPLATAAYKAAERDEVRQTRNVAARAVKAAVEPLRTSETAITHYAPPTLRQKVTQYFKDAHVRDFDREYGTSLYDELLEKRRKEAIFMKAAELSLFDRDSDYYKSQLKRMSKREAR
jgi:hypothetical protein